MKEPPWFEQWFDSPYYHILYANRSPEEAKKFIGKLAEKLQMPPGSKVLDIACGKGRHSITLAGLGFDVTGIDLSKHNIEYAKKFESDKLHFAVGDMREVYQKDAFDYALNLFSSFGYFDDEKEDYKAIDAFAKNLKRGGTLLIDYLNSECTVKHLKSRDILQRGDIQFHLQKKIEDGFIKKKIEFLDKGTHYSYKEQLKMINLFTFKKMMSEAGLEMQQIFGDYNLNQFDASSSERLIMVAKRIN
jgi:2-polyprenyl-3-methyl-5-hydroxy-6-metoxy-1,4-benzoquinol methylase